LISTHQNNLKILKKFNLKQKNKKNLIFFTSIFERQKQTGPSGIFLWKWKNRNKKKSYVIGA